MSRETISLAEKQRFFDSVGAQLAKSCPDGTFKILARETRPWIRKPLYAPRCGLYLDSFQSRRPMYLGFYCVHEVSDDVFQNLIKHKSSIQQVFNEPLQWLNPSVDGNGCNVVIEVPFDMHRRDERHRAAGWSADQLHRFNQVFPI